MKILEKNELGKTGLLLPPVVYGTSYLGNLYTAIPYERKLELMRNWFSCTEIPVTIDTAGKYGAGLALEIIGKGLSELVVDPGDIVISNKLGWYRVPLKGETPTFEPGAWADLDNDCVQRFGYHEIIECFDQGNELLGGEYYTDLVSIHDPDEYLLGAVSPEERDKRFVEILESYRALFDLKDQKKVKAVGIGSKDWTIIHELYAHIPFDWVMFANSFTILTHPPELIRFLDLLHTDGVGIINSAVFHGGFLTGGDKFDYQDLDPSTERGRYLFAWRERFSSCCMDFGLEAGDVCLHFGKSHPAIVSLALNTSKPEKMIRNAETLMKQIPSEFWQTLKDEELVDPYYTYV